MKEYARYSTLQLYYLVLITEMKGEEVIEAQKSNNRDGLAIAYMTIGMFLFSTSFVFLNQHKFHPVSSALARGVSVTVVSYLIARLRGTPLTFPSSHNFKWQSVRNGYMVVQGLAYAWVQFYLPLPIVLTLNSASPIFTAIFDTILYGVHLNRAQKLWLALAFLGVMLTANGNYLTFLLSGTQSSPDSKFQNYKTDDPVVMLGAAVIFTLVMCLHGWGMVITKKLKRTNGVQINYFLGVLLLMSSAVMLPVAFADEEFHRPALGQFLLAVLVSGVPIAMGQLLIIQALLLSKNYGTVTPFQFISIIVAYGISVIRYDQPINVVCLVGAVGIVLGVVFIARCKDKE